MMLTRTMPAMIPLLLRCCLLFYYPALTTSFTTTRAPSHHASKAPKYVKVKKEKEAKAKSSKKDKKASEMPSAVPSSTPSTLPSWQPSRRPSALPSLRPSARPSVAPTALPSQLPSYLPSLLPSSTPSDAPTTVCSSLYDASVTNIFLDDRACFGEWVGAERAAAVQCENFGNTTRTETNPVVECGELVNAQHLCDGYFGSLLPGFDIRNISPNTTVVSVLPNLRPHMDRHTIGPDLFASNLVVAFTVNNVMSVSFVVWCPGEACIGTTLNVRDAAGNLLTSATLPDLMPGAVGLPVGIVATEPVGAVEFFNPGEASEVISELCFG